LQQAIDTLSRAGATLKPGWPPGYDHADLLRTYLFHLQAFFLGMAPRAAQREMAKAGGMNAAGLAPFAEWQRQNLRRLQFRARWQAYLDEVDVFVSPVAFAEAFPHDQSEPMEKRTLATSSGPRPYLDLLDWIALPTLTGLPLDRPTDRPDAERITCRDPDDGPLLGRRDADHIRGVADS
jgi:Asp-tRNA(Asn)/Glu-tRNA(Gln) amidotransferase A subunit family amidase